MVTATRPPNIKVEKQATLAGETPQFLSDLYALARAFPNLIFDVFSGYRSDAYSAKVGGFAGDPHTKGIAADITVGGKPIGQVFSQSQLAKYGLMSGNTPNFYKGKPDPSHLQLSSGKPSASSTPMPQAGPSGGAYAGRPAPGGLQSAFAADVAAATGLDPRVLFAWATEESAYGPQGTGFFNFLNIKGSGTAGTSSGGFAKYGSLKEAVAAADRLLLGPTYKGIEATAGTTPGKEIAAIQASPWDQGHEPALVAIFKRLYGEAALGAKAIDYKTQYPGSDVGNDPFPVTAPGLLGWTTALVKFLAKLTDPAFWIRVLEMLAGGVLLLTGLYLLVRQVGLSTPSPPGPTRRVAETVA